MATLQVKSWRAAGFALGTLGLPLVAAGDLLLIVAFSGRASPVYEYVADYEGDSGVAMAVVFVAVLSMFPGALWGWVSGWCVHLHKNQKRGAARVWSASFGACGTVVSWLGIRDSWQPQDGAAPFDAFGMAGFAPLLVWSLLLILWPIVIRFR